MISRQILPAFLFAVSAAFILGLSACSSTGSGSSAGGSKPAAAPDSPVEAGRKIYTGRCTACHSPEPVLDYTLQEWRDLLPEMSEDAKLNATQEQNLMAYIESHF